MLRIEHLTKIYGEKKAVNDLSLHILPGEIFATSNPKSEKISSAGNPSPMKVLGVQRSGSV